jgi:hypothetical protein
MQHIDVPQHVRQIAALMRSECAAVADSHKLPLSFSGHPALTSLRIDHPAGDALLTLLTTRMLRKGYLCCGQFYPTLAHQEHQVRAFVEALDPVFGELALSITRGDTIDRLGGPVKQSGFARLS